MAKKIQQSWFRFAWRLSGVVGMAFVDHESWSIIRCNAQFGRILGYDESELEGKHLQELYHSSDAATFREALARVVAGDEPSMDSVKRFITKAGTAVICRSICHPLHFEGRVAVMLKQICIVADDRITAEALHLRETVSKLEEDLRNLRGDVRALVGRRSGGDVNIGGSSIRSGAISNDTAIFRWLVVALLVVASIISYGIYIGGWPLHGGAAKPPAVEIDKGATQ